MKLVLDGLISAAQSAFVHGRLINDNIMLAYEGHHYLKRKTQGREGMAALEVHTISTVKYHILHENQQLGPIVPGRGFRHGDPLSLYLFLLVAEGLSALIDRQHVKEDVVVLLGVDEGDTAGRYLGLPLAKVQSWNARFLSRAGREVLLKTVIQPMPSYVMMVFLLPIGLCKEIETIMNEYWWTDSAGQVRGIKWKSWEGLRGPNKFGAWASGS
ncbi:PREDICTED: uncharacterized protein LOC109190114 [Ipomoea nil]|uniref:uncharacterized protein LOC109190114 n=1 Tax=Ipomoea nil TaxID=35883 RepID=UPI0009013091|nr:PREDICTED: uncharacterized protein LOC109190114 [Ipomoea nil]